MFLVKGDRKRKQRGEKREKETEDRDSITTKLPCPRQHQLSRRSACTVNCSVCIAPVLGWACFPNTSRPHVPSVGREGISIVAMGAGSQGQGLVTAGVTKCRWR